MNPPMWLLTEDVASFCYPVDLFGQSEVVFFLTVATITIYAQSRCDTTEKSLCEV